MPAATQVSAFEYEGFWAAEAYYAAAGVTTGMTVSGQALIEAGVVTQDVIIDGITVRFTRVPAGGAFVSPIIYTGPIGAHFMTPFTTATLIGAQHYAPLGIVARFSDTTAFWVLATTQAADAIALSVWGRFLRKDEPTPMPVDVKSVRFWPKRVPEGPI